MGTTVRATGQSSSLGTMWGSVRVLAGGLSDLPWHKSAAFRSASRDDDATRVVSASFTPGSDERNRPIRRSARMARLEAALFVADGAMSARRLAQAAMLADASEVSELVVELNQAYDAVESAFRIEHVARGYQLLTRPLYAFWLDKLHRRQASQKLSPPAIETLAIVAYRQPITRADIEAVRGVQCTDMLKQLMDRGLVRIAGEEESLGRPFLYETTRKFLEFFGLGSLNDLPLAERLRPPRSHEDPTGDEEAEGANDRQPQDASGHREPHVDPSAPAPSSGELESAA